MANKKFLRRILGCFLSLALLISSASAALAEAFDTSAMSPIEKVNYYGDFENGLGDVFNVGGAEKYEFSTDAFAGESALKITTNSFGGIFVKLNLEANTEYTISVKAKAEVKTTGKITIQDRGAAGWPYMSEYQKDFNIGTGWQIFNSDFKANGSNEYRIDFGGIPSGSTVYIDDFTLYRSSDLTTGDNILLNGSFECEKLVGFDASDASKFSLSTDIPYSGDKCLAIAGSSNWENLSQTITVEPNTDYALSLFARTENETRSGALYKVLAADNTTSLVGGDKAMSTFASGDWKRNLVTFNSGSNTSIKFVLVCKPTATFVDDITLTKVSDLAADEVNLINPDFEDLDKGLAAWSNNTIAGISDEPYTGNWSLNLIGDANDKWANTQQRFFVEKNTDYVISFYAKRTEAGNAALCKVGVGSTNLLTNQNWMIGGTVGEWVYNVMSFNSADNSALELTFVRNAVGALVDDIHIAKKANVTVNATEGGSVTKSTDIVGIGDTLKMWAEKNVGYNFVGWYLGDTLLSTDVAYTHTVTGDAAIVARFEKITVNVADIPNPGFEESEFTGWQGDTDIFELVTTEVHSGAQALRIKGNNEILQYRNASLAFDVEPNTDYVIHFYGKRQADDSFTLVHVMAGSTDLLEKQVGINGLALSEVDFDHSQWGLNEIEFNSGDNYSVALAFQVANGSSYVDDIYIAKKINVEYQSNSTAYGTVIASNKYFAYGEEYTLTATPNADREFLGWYNESGELVSNELTYIASVAAKLTAKFKIDAGDADLDGTIGNEDMVLIRKALIGSEVIDETAADANGDGKFNIIDLVHIKKMLAEQA